MKTVVRPWRAAAAVVALSLASLSMATVAGLAAQEQKPAVAPPLATPVSFTAMAANLNASNPGFAALTLQIRIDRWTTDAQQEELFSALREKGQEALLKLLLGQPRVGYMRTPGSLGYDLRYARFDPWGDGGYAVSMMTDRYVGFAEAANQPRTLDYRITMIDMKIKKNGKGEGTLSPATKMILAGNMLVLENYDIQPILLQSVQMQIEKKK